MQAPSTSDDQPSPIDPPGPQATACALEPLLSLPVHEHGHFVALELHGFACTGPHYGLCTHPDGSQQWRGWVTVEKFEYTRLLRDFDARVIVGLAGIVAERVLADLDTTVEEIMRGFIEREFEATPEDLHLAELVDSHRVGITLEFVRKHWDEILASATADHQKLLEGLA